MEAVYKRQRTGIILLLLEISVCLILAITALIIHRLSSYSYVELDNDVYVESTIGSKIETETYSIEDDGDGTEDDWIDNRTTESETDAVKTYDKEYRNILIIGTDARGQTLVSGGANSDVMIIASINNYTGEIRLVSILRDCVLKMETGSRYFNKANAQFCMTGISDTVSMINRNFGLDIDEYVIVNWYGVAQVINALGGIEVTIPNDTILYYFNSYLTFTNEATGLWAPQLSSPGTYNMTGTQVVAFCRIRYGGYNDFGRTQNQRECIQKLINKSKDLIIAGEIDTVIGAATVGIQNVVTNLSLQDVIDILSDASKFTTAGNMQFPQNYVSGGILSAFHAKYGINDCLMPSDFASEVTSLHNFLFPDLEYTPSETVTTISNEMRAEY